MMPGKAMNSFVKQYSEGNLSGESQIFSLPSSEKSKIMMHKDTYSFGPHIGNHLYLSNHLLSEGSDNQIRDDC